ncbi:MAG: hypothetical protein ABI457_00030 [Hyphomicrobium sp.]
MANVWQEKPFIDEPQFDAMAGVLEAKHGQYAAMVADFFSAAHAQNGDNGRAAAWADVAERVRERQYERLLPCPD